MVEILVVVAIIAILIAAVGLVGTAVRERGRDKLTRQTMATVMAAIEDYRAKRREYPPCPNHTQKVQWNDSNYPNPPVIIPYEPADDRDPLTGRTRDPAYADNQYEYYLGRPHSIFYLNQDYLTTANMLPDRSILSSEGLYVLLNTVVDAKTVLGKLPQGAALVRRAGCPYPQAFPWGWDGSTGIDVLMIVDGWKRPMRYRRYEYRNNGVPFLWSAGPDGKFARDPNRVEGDPDGADDIFSDKAE